jgi:hypothetical protein
MERILMIAEAETCRCVRCTACGGSGTVRFVDLGGNADEIAEAETCYECGGSGASVICAPCLKLRELERERQERIERRRRRQELSGMPPRADGYEEESEVAR